MSSVAVSFSKEKAASARENKSGPFRERQGGPDSVDSQNFWQKHDRAGKKDEGAQKREKGGNGAVGQGGKHGRNEKVEAAKQKADRENRKALFCDLIYRRRRRSEESNQIRAFPAGENENRDGRPCDETYTQREHPFLLAGVFLAQIVANDGRDANRIADKNGVEQKLRIDQDRDGGDTLLVCENEHSAVEQKGRHGAGNLRNHFGRAVP